MGKFGILILWIDSPIAYSIRTVTLLEVALHHMVVFCRTSFWHIVVWNIRYGTEQVAQFFLGIVHSFLTSLVLLFQFSDLFLYFLCFLFLSFLHQSTDLGCHLLCFLLGLVEHLLRLATALVNGEYIVNGFLCSCKVFLFETTYHAVCVLSNEFQCKHNYYLFRLCSSIMVQK